MVKKLKININFSNRTAYTLIAVGVLILVGVGVWAYTSSIPNPGHGGDTVWVRFNNTEQTLQQALDQVYSKTEIQNFFSITGRCPTGYKLYPDKGTDIKKCYKDPQAITSDVYVAEIYYGCSNPETCGIVTPDTISYVREGYCSATLNNGAIAVTATCDATTGSSASSGAVVWDGAGDSGVAKIRCPPGDPYSLEINCYINWDGVWSGYATYTGAGDSIYRYPEINSSIINWERFGEVK